MIDFWTLNHNGWKMKFIKSIVMLYTVWWKIFTWSKIRIEVTSKNENLKSYKKKCYNYLEIRVKSNIITDLWGWEICLALVFWGCLQYALSIVMCFKKTIGVFYSIFLYMYGTFDCFLETSGVHGTFPKVPGVLRNFNFHPFP